MKHLHLKLGIGIVVVFGLLLAGFALYEPVWFKYYEWRLGSDNAATRESAARVIAAKEKKALPYVEEWLTSGNEKTVIRALGILEYMNAEEWTALLPEIEEILRGMPSRITSRAAGFIYSMKRPVEVIRKPAAGCDDGVEWSGEEITVNWKEYENDRKIIRNICLYILDMENDSFIVSSAASKLIYFRDKSVIMPLIRILKSGNACGEISPVINILSAFSDKRAVEPILGILEQRPDSMVCWNAIMALAKIRDTRAVNPLINLMLSEKIHFARNSYGSLRVNKTNLETVDLKQWCAVALTQFESPETYNALEKARLRGNDAAVFALALMRGGKDLALAREMNKTGREFLQAYLEIAEARHGNMKALHSFLEEPRKFYHTYRLDFGVIKILPIKKPIDDPDDLRNWYKKNKHRLAWDADKHKYFLKPQGRETK